MDATSADIRCCSLCSHPQVRRLLPAPAERHVVPHGLLAEGEEEGLEGQRVVDEPALLLVAFS